MALEPTVYANLLLEKIKRHKVACWLVNTGWINGPYGVGERINIQYTRAIIRAILNGKLNQVTYRRDERFGFEVPENCPDLPVAILDPSSGWTNKEDYKEQADKLAFSFKKEYSNLVKIDNHQEVSLSERN